MFKAKKRFKVFTLSALLIAAVTISSYAATNYSSFLVKGNYTATDVAWGAVKIAAVNFSEDYIMITFWDGKSPADKDGKLIGDPLKGNIDFLILKRVSGSKNKVEKGKDVQYTATYRGFTWKEPVVVHFDDICVNPEDEKTFYIKITTDIDKLMACDSSMLTFKCTALQVFFDGHVFVEPSNCCM